MKKLNVFSLLAAGLVIVAYFLVRFYLQGDIRNSRNKVEIHYRHQLEILILH